MARSFAGSQAESLLIIPGMAGSSGENFFPLPSPYVEQTASGYRGIFPALWPALGGASYILLGPSGFYLLPSLALAGLLWCLFVFLRNSGSPLTTSWTLVVVASALLFYGLTFWEHGLALLLLMPLLSAVGSRTEKPHRWILAGLAFGVSICLRPESALLLPCLLLLPASNFGKKTTVLLRVGAMVIAVMALGALLERALSGRWMALQIPFNLSLSFGDNDLLDRLGKELSLLADSPLPGFILPIGLLSIAFFAALLRNFYLVAFGLPLLSILGLASELISGSAFSITGHSQGLFFAWPWVALSLPKLKNLPRRKDPFFILGWGYLLLASLFGPDQPGMHWGPRFLFPALIPLAIRSAQALEQMPVKISRWLLIITSVAAGLFAVGSVISLAQRGQAGREIVGRITEDPIKVLALDRWHYGADLEPLWGTRDLAWVRGEGDLEELLLALRDLNITENVAFLSSEDECNLIDYPIEIVSDKQIPRRAGWGGALLKFSLASPSDGRWGNAYWHAGRRRAEKGQLGRAKEFLERAVAIEPENPDIHYDLAICLGKMGLVSEAISELREVLHLDPTHEAAGLLMRQLGVP